MESLKRGALVMLCILLLTSLASAEIVFSQPKTLYNLNDRFEIKINLFSQTEKSDFLVAKLICSDQEIEVYRSPITITPPISEEAKISVRLGQFLIGTTSGSCYIKASFAGEESTSPTFEITPEINLDVKIEGAIYSPNDKVVISGKADKKNGEKFRGFLEVNIPALNLHLSNSVENGSFRYDFIVPEGTPAGVYDLEILAYEKDTNDAVTNQGQSTGKFSVRQVIKKVSITLETSSILPEKSLTYSAYVTDQSDEQVQTDVSISITSSDGVSVEKKMVESGQQNTLTLSSDAKPGSWIIDAVASDFNDAQSFIVEEYKKLSFTYDESNKTLILKNIGNVPYVGPVEIKIGDFSEIKDVSLEIGETKSYRLRAPNGVYSISATDGTEITELGKTALTGRAISVTEPSSYGSNLWTLLLLVLILLAAIGAVFIYRKLSRKNPLAGTEQQKIKLNKPSEFAPGSEKKVVQENNSSIDTGNKEEATIISVYLKSPTIAQNKPAMQVVDSALWKAKEAGAKVYTDDQFKIAILSQTLTKQKDNTFKALKLAQDMERVLKEHNKHSTNKIDFGLAVHEGNLIVENSGGGFKFVSTDNSMVNTKKLSQHSNAEILISEKLHRKTLGKVKAMKVSDKNIWRVDRVIDREEHKDYIRKSLKG